MLKCGGRDDTVQLCTYIPRFIFRCLVPLSNRISTLVVSSWLFSDVWPRCFGTGLGIFRYIQVYFVYWLIFEIDEPSFCPPYGPSQFMCPIFLQPDLASCCFQIGMRKLTGGSCLCWSLDLDLGCQFRLWFLDYAWKCRFKV